MWQKRFLQTLFISVAFPRKLNNQTSSYDISKQIKQSNKLKIYLKQASIILQPESNFMQQATI